MATRVSRRPARSSRELRPRHMTRRRRSKGRRNRRRGAPRSAVVRRVLALVLVACAVLLALRDHQAASASAGSTPAGSAGSGGTAEQPAETLLPLVLEVADATTVTVLEEGQLVDVYAAYDEQPPALVLSGVRLLDVRAAGDTGAGSQPRPAHIVIGITMNQHELVESLLAAQLIVATVSAIHFDTSSR